MSDLVSQLQQDIADVLNAEPFFLYITVLQEKEGVTDNDVLEALGGRRLKNGKSGISVTIDMPSVRVDCADIGGVRYELTLVIRVLEFANINRAGGGTNIPVEAVCQQLDQFFLGYRFGTTILLPEGRGGIRTETKDGAIVGYDCSYKITLQMPSPPRVMNCPITQGGVPAAVVAITSNTAGASIYYTTDGSAPTNLKTLYATPFAAPAAGTLIRASAYKAGFFTSWISEYTAI